MEYRIKKKKYCKENGQSYICFNRINYSEKGTRYIHRGSKKLSSEDKIRAEFYIIGKPVKNNYAEKILEEIKGMDNVFITGEMTRTELHSFLIK